MRILRSVWQEIIVLQVQLRTWGEVAASSISSSSAVHTDDGHDRDDGQPDDADQAKSEAMGLKLKLDGSVLTGDIDIDIDIFGGCMTC